MELPDLDFNPWEKSPLERMYDRWKPDWERGTVPKTTYIIYAANDIVWRGTAYLAGQSFRCRLCGSGDEWTLEGTEKHPVFVCEHEPIQLTRGGLRQIDSVPARVVGKVDEIACDNTR